MKQYAVVCTFEEIDIITFFAKNSYKAAISSDFTASHVHSFSCVIDTGTRPNLP